jgi:hypothetical protein
MSHSKIKPQQATVAFRTYVIAVLIIAVGAYGLYRLMARSGAEVPSGDTRALAQCLTDSGAKMYGTFWCPHCQKQKEAFGDAFGLVNYVECTLNGQQDVLNPVCADAGVSSFPTWVFGDGTRQSGELSFSVLAERSGCAWRTDSQQTAANP